jgi:hypothetical protein
MNSAQTILSVRRGGLTIVLLLSLLAALPCRGQTTKAGEYEIKAAYLFNFTMFIERSATATQAEDRPVVIGIVGRDAFGKAFAPVEGKKTGGGNRVLEVRRLDKSADAGALASCDVVFLDLADPKDMKAALGRLKGTAVLTVSDSPGFLDAGGMVVLVVKEKTVRWEINRSAIRSSRLTVSAQLYRSAARVLEFPDRE